MVGVFELAVVAELIEGTGNVITPPNVAANPPLNTTLKPPSCCDDIAFRLALTRNGEASGAEHRRHHEKIDALVWAVACWCSAPALKNDASYTELITLTESARATDGAASAAHDSARP